MKVSVSILSSKYSALDLVKKIENTNADYIHLDVMDGKFVQNKSWSYSEILKIVSNTSKKLDVHLMVNDPFKYIENYALLNTEYITFHYEAVNDIMKTINTIKEYGLKVGIAIKPDTSVNSISEYLKYLDQVLVMSVYPGASGQQFIGTTINKISELRDEINRQKLNTIISVDGGINDITSKTCISAGVDMLVSASFIHSDVEKNINILKNDY